MLYLIIKALLSGIIVAIVSEVSRKFPGLGGLTASLPLVSVLGMMWLWTDTGDPERLALHSTATFWFVLPSLPMFLLIPILLNWNIPFWYCLALSCLLTITLYLGMLWFGPRIGVRL